MHSLMKRLIGLTAVAAISLGMTTQVQAQITDARKLSTTIDRFANLEEQLTNRLRATAVDQRGFVQFIVQQVRLNRLDVRLVVALERYAMKRNPSLPFPYFERAIRFEADKRGLTVPPVRRFADSRSRLVR